jgi:hypothetical protein
MSNRIVTEVDKALVLEASNTVVDMRDLPSGEHRHTQHSAQIPPPAVPERDLDRLLDEALSETFPASDPVAISVVPQSVLSVKSSTSCAAPDHRPQRQ